MINEAIIERLNELKLEIVNLEQIIENENIKNENKLEEFKFPGRKIEGKIDDEIIKRLLGPIKEYEYIEKCKYFNSRWCETCKSRFCVDLVDDVNDRRSPMIGFDFNKNIYELFKI